MGCTVIEQSEDLQIELCNMQTDLELISLKNENVKGIQFWKQCSKVEYPKLHDNMLQIYSMFAGNFAYEQKFSVMNKIKTKNGARLTEKNLETFLYI